MPKRKKESAVYSLTDVQDGEVGVDAILNMMTSRNLNFTPSVKKMYANLKMSEKLLIIRFVCDQIRGSFYKAEGFRPPLYKFFYITEHDSDGEVMKLFLETLLAGNLNVEFLKEVTQALFEILDNEFKNENKCSRITSNCLAIIIEIGIKVGEENNDNETTHGHKLNSFLDYMTSNMISRSNINSDAMRIALVYYLVRVDKSSHIHLEKILTRFGQSLLDHIFDAYFKSREKSEAAFSFLINYLSFFLGGSPALAQMSHSILLNQMLKNTASFTHFIQKYILSVEKKHDNINSLTIHISFLLKEMCDIGQKDTIQDLLNVLMDHISYYDASSPELYVRQYETAVDIISQSKTDRAKMVIKSIEEKITIEKRAYFDKNIIKMNRFKKKKEENISKNIESVPYSSLSEIILLAS
jgi:hypothetical protein